MAIKGPKNPRSFGYISSQFSDMLAIHQANFEREQREAQEKSEAFWAKMTLGVGALKEIKQYRDAYLADKRLDKVKFKSMVDPISMYQKGQKKERDLFKGKYLQKAKDFIWTPDLEVNEELRQFVNQKKNILDDEGNIIGVGTEDVLSTKDKSALLKQLRGKGMSEEQLNDLFSETKKGLGYKDKKKIAPPALPEMPFASDDEFEDTPIEVKDTTVDKIPEMELPAVMQLEQQKGDKFKQSERVQQTLDDLGRGEVEKIEHTIPERPSIPFAEDDDDYDLLMEESIERDKQKAIDVLGGFNIKEELKSMKGKEDTKAYKVYQKLDEEGAYIKGRNKKGKPVIGNISKDLDKMVAPKKEDKKWKMPTPQKIELEKDAPIDFPDLDRDAVMMMTKGGKLKGPSHKEGGIPANVGDQPIEMEGGEYVIKKSSANKIGKKALDYINKTGKLPKKMQEGGYIEDENNDPDYVGMGRDAMGVYENIESLQRTGGVSSAATGLSLGATGAEYAGKGAEMLGFEKASKNLGKTSTALGGALAVGSEDETGLTQASGVVGMAQGASDISKTLAPKLTEKVGEKVGEKIGEKVGEKAASIGAKGLGGVAPGIGIATGARDLLSHDATTAERVGGAASIASGAAGIAALTSTAAANFWNPVGWAAGAVAIGATAANLMGIGGRKNKVQQTRAAKIRV